jgi:PAS domain S-box-containing protein
MLVYLDLTNICDSQDIVIKFTKIWENSMDKTNDTLSDLQTLQRVILDAAGEGIYGIDKNGNITFGNTATTEILGWAADEIVGKSAHDVHHHSHADGSRYPRDECPIYAAIKDGQVHHVDNEVFWHTSGQPVPIEYTSTPIWRDGKPDGAVVVFHDITERKAMEAGRQKAYEEVRALKEQLELERDYLRDELEITVNFGDIVGESDALKHTLSQIEAVAATPATVLILGESGVGKEMIARAIHTNSDRADNPLVKVNCASIPKDLFESEFFGHVRGAFTGAHADRIGRMQLANGGTLFLDEVGEIPMALQGKLLRALQERQFERVGEDKTISTDVRIVAATNRDLEVEVSEGRFREDLFYRLSVFPLTVPPLRNRAEDIVPLAHHFVEEICHDLGRPTLRISKQSAELLLGHNWPGNIRELRNVIERAIIMSKNDRLTLIMPESNPTMKSSSVTVQQSDDFLTDAEMREREKANILNVLRLSNWRISGNGGAADLLGLKASTLSYRMSTFGIEKGQV